MSTIPTLIEAQRVLNICNACGYCNGFCDVFVAAQRRPALTERDCWHLAHLCHGCRNCLYACQYAPPHPFAVNVPRTLAALRQQQYHQSTWPRPGWHLYGARRALAITAGITALLWGMVLLTVPTAVLFTAPAGSGTFYRILPWWVMVLLGGVPLGWAVLICGMSWHRYWRHTRSAARITWRDWWRAGRDVVTLRNRRGGGPGCNDTDGQLSHAHRWLHQLLLTGGALCAAATLVAGYYHHFHHWTAPYPYTSWPVLLGGLGGSALVVALVGLIGLKWREDVAPTDAAASASDRALLTVLLLVSVSGLALLAGRASAAMAILLVIHLGSVTTLLVLLPYCKFVHAGYRVIALVVNRQRSTQNALTMTHEQ